MGGGKARARPALVFLEEHVQPPVQRVLHALGWIDIQDGASIGAVVCVWMIRRYELSQNQWERIAHLLPGKAGDPRSCPDFVVLPHFVWNYEASRRRRRSRSNLARPYI